MQSESNTQKPTAFQLLGDAIDYARPNFATFLLYGGGLILVLALTSTGLRWFEYDHESLGLDVFALAIVFLAIFVEAQFAYNVHRFVLSGQRGFSLTLNRTFWVFFAAIFAIQLAFLIPEEFVESYLSVEQVSEWRGSQSPLSLSLSSSGWVLLAPAAQFIVELLVFMLIAIFLTIPPGIVAHGKIELSANLKIGGALYWPIFWGLLILYAIYSLYALLVGISSGWSVPFAGNLDDAQFVLVTLVLQSVLLAPLSFFYVLLGATFTSADFIRGSNYLGLPDPVRSNT